MARRRCRDHPHLPLAVRASNRISRGDLQPGDLVFYGHSVSRISHVAMYLGDGRVVEATYTGANVRVRGDGLARRDIVGYGRV